MNEKDCFDDSIVDFGFGVGRVPLVAPPWPSSLQSALRLKMRRLLNSQPCFSKFSKEPRPWGGVLYLLRNLLFPLP